MSGGSVNKVLLVGNLGKEPEVRRTQDGKAIVSFSLATSESWKDKSSGERKERTEWHRVVIMNDNLAKLAEQYLHKGSKVYLEGQIQTRKWQDNQGQERYVTEVVIGFNGTMTMLEAPKQNGAARERPADIKPPTGNAPQQPRRAARDDMDDEIPF